MSSMAWSSEYPECSFKSLSFSMLLLLVTICLLSSVICLLKFRRLSRRLEPWITVPVIPNSNLLGSPWYHYHDMLYQTSLSWNLGSPVSLRQYRMLPLSSLCQTWIDDSLRRSWPNHLWYQSLTRQDYKNPEWRVIGVNFVTIRQEMMLWCCSSMWIAEYKYQNHLHNSQYLPALHRVRGKTPATTIFSRDFREILGNTKTNLVYKYLKQHHRSSHHRTNHGPTGYHAKPTSTTKITWDESPEFGHLTTRCHWSYPYPLNSFCHFVPYCILLFPRTFFSASSNQVILIKNS